MTTPQMRLNSTTPRPSPWASAMLALEVRHLLRQRLEARVEAVLLAVRGELRRHLVDVGDVVDALGHERVVEGAAGGARVGSDDGHVHRRRVSRARRLCFAVVTPEAPEARVEDHHHPRRQLHLAQCHHRPRIRRFSRARLRLSWQDIAVVAETPTDLRAVEEIAKARLQIKHAEIEKRIIGQRAVVDQLLSRCSRAATPCSSACPASRRRCSSRRSPRR